MAEASNENEAQIAFMCQFCDQQNVKWKCMDCGVYLCNSCKEKIHLRLKSTEKHRILSIQYIGKNQCFDNEPWFHGKITYAEAEELLHKYKYMGDGAFLVRESSSSIGNYCIDFLKNGEPKHLRILTIEESGQLKYYHEDSPVFDSLNAFIENLLTSPSGITLNGVECGELIINEPIPKATV